METNIPDTLFARIQALATQQNLSTEQVLEQMVTQYERNVAPPGSAAELVQSAREANIGAEGPYVDTSTRSREILENEYADYLKNRQDRDPDVSSD